MTSATRHLKDTITYWPVTGSDGYGGFTFGAAATMLARWEYSTVEFLTNGGEQAISNAVVYIASNVTVGDFLAEGNQTEHADPADATGAFTVRQFMRNTDLRNLNNIRKAFL